MGRRRHEDMWVTRCDVHVYFGIPSTRFTLYLKTPNVREDGDVYRRLHGDHVTLCSTMPFYYCTGVRFFVDNRSRVYGL